MVNDGHDTTIDFAGQWVDCWLAPLLNDTIFNDNPNWGLESLGRGDTNKMLSNVYSFVANATGYTNLDVAVAYIPLTNITSIIPGPLNAQLYVPITAPNTSAVGTGGGAVLVASGLDTSFTAAKVPSPVNLTARKGRPCRGSPPASQHHRLTRPVTAAMVRQASGRASSALLCSARSLRAL
ncbi:hypothetical protein EDB92DRAFT_2113442 [Lactarius akahatsu]|uniref:Uncharacterized protein n=1 Tax=Lactarius akahatsu TaxID=416441 RepID=A0AAD4LJD8_9AGAM|nr:hypothetical protein EDB92DRAFT_2113442 [Lactarius akahatsu]